MAQKKINQLSPERNSSIPAPFQFTKHETQLLYYLNQDTGNRNLSEILKNYVKDEDVVDNLKKILTDPMDSITTFVGYRGIGKTTDIQYTFNVWNNTPKLWSEHSTIVIPLFFGGFVADDTSEVRRELGKRISSVCTAMLNADELDGLIPAYGSSQSTNEIYRFLSTTNPKAMEGSSGSSDRPSDILKATIDNDFFVYAATRLKYYMAKTKHKYNRILLILDDVEHLPSSVKLPMIEQCMQMYKCLRNFPEYSKRDYNINLLLSLQPQTYREAESQGIIAPHRMTREIYKTNRINLQKYFQQKRASVPASLNETDPEKWKSAYGILRALSERFDGKYANMILGLTNLDIPRTLNVFKDILSNPVWVTRNTVDGDASYIFNNISVIRAIACGFDEVYMSRRDSLIPNIFYNTDQNDYSVECLYVISCFSAKDADFLQYGERALTKQEVIKAFHDVFGDDKEETLSERVSKAVDYLYDCGILEASNFNSVKRLNELPEDEKLLLSAKGSELWDMLENDSVLMELFREDRFIEDNLPEPRKYMSSKKLIEDINDQLYVFTDTQDILLYLFKEYEAPLLQKMKERKTEELYYNVFGVNTVAERLLIGITKSINYSGKYWEDAILKRDRNLIDEINKLSVKVVNSTLKHADN